MSSSTLAGDEPALCAELRAEVGRRWDLDALHAAVLRSQEDRRLVLAGLNEGRSAGWAFAPQVGTESLHGRDDLYELQRRRAERAAQHR